MADYIYYVTVSGGAFLIDGESQAELGLKAGLTYRFDVSDASCASQTFKFSTTSDGTHGGGSEYTTNVTVTGTAGSSGATVDLVVPSSTGTLYYYNGAASGYGGTIRYTTDTYVSTTNLGLKVPLPGASDDVWASHLNASLRTIDSVVEGKAPLDSPAFTGGIQTNSITDFAGTGAPDFPNGLTNNTSPVYSRSNILGTVSQSSGVPTGAIIERGSNANGEYVKYADGTLICQGGITFTQITSSCAQGTLTLPATSSASNSEIYPHFFASDSRASGGTARLYSDADIHSFSRRYLTTLDFRIMASGGLSWTSGQTVLADYTVITRWY